jgi:hypothetical protein
MFLFGGSRYLQLKLAGLMVPIKCSCWLSLFTFEARQIDGTEYTPRMLWTVLLLCSDRDVNPFVPNFLNQKSAQFSRLHRKWVPCSTDCAPKQFNQLVSLYLLEWIFSVNTNLCYDKGALRVCYTPVYQIYTAVGTFDVCPHQDTNECFPLYCIVLWQYCIVYCIVQGAICEKNYRNFELNILKISISKIWKSWICLFTNSSRSLSTIDSKTGIFVRHLMERIMVVRSKAATFKKLKKPSWGSGYTRLGKAGPGYY